MDMETDRVNIEGKKGRRTLFYPDQFNLVLDAISEKLGKEFNLSVDLEVRRHPYQELIKVINTIKEGKYKYSGKGRIPNCLVRSIKDNPSDSLIRLVGEYFEGEKINKFTVKISSSIREFEFSESFNILESDKSIQIKTDHLIREIEYLKEKENGAVY